MNFLQNWNFIPVDLKRNPVMCMDEPWEYCTKWKTPVTEGKVLYDFSYVRC
jgi:hypothetical protein